jgi:hypothetical protein
MGRIGPRLATCLALALAACAACAAGRPRDERPGAAAVLGTWTGTSVCVGNRPACKNEEVVYRFVPVDGKPEFVRLLGDKIIDGKRVPMGALELRYDEADHSLTGEFMRGQTHGMWRFTVSGDAMKGNLFTLPDKTVARDVDVHRVRDDEVPPAPPLEEYEAAAPPTTGNISAARA